MLVFIQIARLSRVGSRRSCPTGLVCEPEEGGALCLRGFFSVCSNYGTELSQTLLLSVGICFLLRSRIGVDTLTSETATSAAGVGCSGGTEENGVGLYYRD